MTPLRQVISHLFNIEDSEWPLVLTLFALIGVTTVGAIWGSTVAYAGLLKVVGIGALPWILGGAAILSIVGAAVYSAFTDVLSNGRLMVGIYVIGIVSLLIGLGLLRQGSLLAYPLLYLLYVAWLPVYNPHLITFITGFTDVQSAKRVVPVVLAGMRVGLIVSGLTMVLLNRWFSPEGIIIIWLVTYIASIGLVWLAPRFALDRTEAELASARRASHASYLTSLREGAAYTRKSPFLRWMLAAGFVLLMMLTLMEYRSSQLLADAFPTQTELSSYLALLGALGNIVALPLLLFGLSRLVARFGLSAAGLIFPVLNLVVSAWLFLVPGAASASAAYLDRSAMRAAFQFPIEGLLFNAIPLKVRARARAFGVGLIGPLGAFLGSLLLLLPLAAHSEWFVASLVLALAVVFLAVAFVIRREYSRALVRMLQEEDYSSLLHQDTSVVMVADPRTLSMLKEQLEASRSRDLTVFLAQLMTSVGGRDAIPILVSMAQNAPDAATRSAILDALSISGVSDSAVEDMYLDCLSSPDADVRLSGIVGLERLAPATVARRMPRLLGMVNDPDLDVRVAVLSTLARVGSLEEVPSAAEALAALLSDPDPVLREGGVRVLCQQRDPLKMCAALIPFLGDTSELVKLQALHGIDGVMSVALPDPLAAQLFAALTILTRDHDEPVRLQAVTLLGRGQQWKGQAAPIIAEALADPSAVVRSTAVDTLSQMGAPVVEVLSPYLRSDSPWMRQGAAIALCRVGHRAYKPVIQELLLDELRVVYEIHNMLHAIQALPPLPGVAVLYEALHERTDTLIEEIFHTLTALEPAPSVNVIHQHLCGATHARANACEALEALTTPQIGTLVASLCDPHRQGSHLMLLCEETWAIAPYTSGQALEHLAQPAADPLLRAVALFALGEVGLLSDGAAGHEARSGTPARRTARATFHFRLGRHESEKTEDANDGGEASRTEHATFNLVMGRRSGGASEGRGPHTALSQPSSVLPRQRIDALLDIAETDADEGVRQAARAARRTLGGKGLAEPLSEGGVMLSTIERVIFLKQVPFFQGMTVDQLRVLANVCEERTYAPDNLIYSVGDPGGVLYVVVDGKVGIEHEKRGGSVARLATLGSNSYFGEMDLFDDHPRSTSAVAVEATDVLELRREPLVELSRQYPDMSLELIKVLSARLREANDRIVELTRSRPRELNRLYDKLD